MILAQLVKSVGPLVHVRTPHWEVHTEWLGCVSDVVWSVEGDHYRENTLTGEVALRVT